MSSRFTNIVWSCSATQGTHRVVMLALAEAADRKGGATISQRDLAEMARVVKARVQTVLADLVDMGELKIRSKGPNRISQYQIILPDMAGPRLLVEDVDLEPDALAPGPVFNTPEIEPALTEKIPLDAEEQQKRPRKDLVALTGTRSTTTSGDLQSILSAAGVKPPPDQPLYWSRREHREQLEEELSMLGMNTHQLVDLIKSAASEGKKPRENPRTIAHVLQVIR